MKHTDREVFVIGHRNPDTDSICAAIGYAYLKQQQGWNAVAARAGNVNPETAFVLQYFGLEAPQLVNDLYPRTQDVLQVCSDTVLPEATLRDVGKLLIGKGKKSLPVVSADGMLQGIVTVSDLAARYYRELELEDLAEAGVSFDSLAKAIDAQFVTAAPAGGQLVKGRVRIAAAAGAVLQALLGKGDIVLIGDRPQDQRLVIGAGCACLILTAGTEPDAAVLAEAEEKGVFVLTTQHDTYTVARLIQQSVPVQRVMRDAVVSFGPSELLSDVRERIAETNYRNYPITEHGRFVGLLDRSQMIVPQRPAIILVDHNERGQAVEGSEEADILEIIDHHRLGGLITGDPIFIRSEPIGSTSSIVATMIKESGVPFTRAVAGALLGAIISDTLFFRSPTGTPRDKEIAEELAAIAGVDIESFALAVLKSGSEIMTKPAAKLVTSDIKEFTFGDYRFAIGQVNTMDRQDALTREKELHDALEEFRKKEHFDAALLMVTDILAETTDLIAAGGLSAQLVKAFGEPGKTGSFYLPGVLSRKKQIIPPLTEAFR